LTTAEPAGSELARVALHWLDGRTGRTLATTPLLGQTGNRPVLSLLVSFQNRLIGLMAADYRQPERDLVELEPAPEGVVEREFSLPRAWQGYSGPRSKLPPSVLPGWLLLSSGIDKKTGILPMLDSQRDAVVTLAARGES